MPAVPPARPPRPSRAVNEQRGAGPWWQVGRFFVIAAAPACCSSVGRRCPRTVWRLRVGAQLRPTRRLRAVVDGEAVCGGVSGTQPGMASMTERIMFLRAVRQLHRVRSLYAAGVLVWAASAAWTGWQAPGSRQMWISVLLLAVFTGLLVTAGLFLRGLEAPQRAGPRITPHPASRHAPVTRTPDRLVGRPCGPAAAGPQGRP